MSYLRLLGVIAPVATLCGCASIVSSPEQKVAITTDPPGAVVQVGDQVIQSPGTVTLQRKNNYTIRVSREGYYDNYAPLRSVESPWVLGNFLCLWDMPTTALYMTITQGMNGFHVIGPGSIYDRMTGAGYQLVPGKIDVALEQRSATDPAEEGSSPKLRLNLHIVKEIALPHPGWEVYSEGGSLWVVHGADMSRIDPQTNELVETLPRPYCPVHFADSNSLWFVPRPYFGSSNLCEMDRRTQKVSVTVPLPKGANTVLFGEGAFWALALPQGLGSAHKPLEVHKIDPQSLSVVSRIPLDETLWPAAKPGFQALPHATLTVGLGSVWVTRGNVLVRIDADSNAVAATIPLPYEPSCVLCGTDALWVFGGGGHEEDHVAPERFARIDPATNRVGRSMPYPGRARGRAAGLGVIWVLNGEQRTQTLQWIDPQTGVVTKSPLPLGESRSFGLSLAFHQGDLWVVKGNSLLRLAKD